MPVHNIPAGSLHEDLVDLQRQGEIIEHVVRTSRNMFVVVTRFPAGTETRPAHRLDGLTHETRLGITPHEALLNSFVSDDIVRGEA